MEALTHEAEHSQVSEEDLNRQMREYLLLQTEADIKESILAFDCIVGDQNCIYKDKKALASGKMTPNVKTKLTQKLVKKPIVAKKNTLAVKSLAKSVAKPGVKKIVKNKVPGNKSNVLVKTQGNSNHKL